VEVELLYLGYYRGPATFLDSYTFLKLYPDGRWVFAETMDPAYDFPAHMKALGFEALSRERPSGWLEDGGTNVTWGRYRRGRDIPALNWGGQVVGRLDDALEETHLSLASGFRFQVEVVGPGQLRPTTHEVILTFVPDQPAEREGAPRPSPPAR
jgi:hypothetical protein